VPLFLSVRREKGLSLVLPGGTQWVDFWTGDRIDGGRTVEKPVPIDIMTLYVRAGSIISMGPRLQFSTEKPADPIELRIYPGSEGRFTLYEDQNEGYGYEKCVYAEIPMEWNNAGKSLTIGSRHGSFLGMLTQRTFNVVLVRKDHGVSDAETTQPDKVVRYSGKKVVVQLP
jgi:alpha-D-xyloside xylohydrolase